MSVNALYLRISQDRDGNEVALDRQRTESLALAARLGFEDIREYADNDTSATSGVARPAFDRMIADRPAVIFAWAQDRLLRLTTDLERVIELGVPVHTVVAGTLDLATPAGRAVARTVAAWSTFEGEQKADRQRAKNRQQTGSGAPLKGGRRAFGYEADHMTPHPVEAALVREAYTGFIAGRSLYSIAMEWRADGILTPSGHTWNGPKLGRILRNPRNKGTLIYRGVAGTESQIVPLVDAETFDTVTALLNAPERKMNRGPNKRTTLLGGYIRCECGATMRSSSKTTDGKPVRLYVCSAKADGLVTGTHPLIRRHIADELFLGAILPWMVWVKRDGGDLRTAPTTDMAPQQAEIARLRVARTNVQRLAEFEGADVAGIAARSAELGREIASAEAVLVAAQNATQEGSLLAALETEFATLEDFGDVAQSFLKIWGGLPLTLQRQVAALFEVVVSRGAGNGRVRVTRNGQPIARIREHSETGEVSLYVPTS